MQTARTWQRMRSTFEPHSQQLVTTIRYSAIFFQATTCALVGLGSSGHTPQSALAVVPVVAIPKAQSVQSLDPPRLLK